MPIVKMRRVDGIIISVTNYIWTPGIQTIQDELSEKDYARFMLYLAEYMRDELVKAINTQRYATGTKKWAPLNVKYLRYKKKHNLSLNIWEATSTLKEGIQIFKRDHYIVVGFKKTDVYPNTTVKINKIAQYVEYGGKKLPPRPLFRSITAHLRRHVDRQYKKFRKEVLKLK
jgi:hypothetical protein